MSGRTVRRRAVDYKIAPPGEPVFKTIETDNGPVVVHTTATRATSDISDADLDVIMESILTSFPTRGIQMLTGLLLSLGEDVARERLQSSFVRVHGPPAAFGSHPIDRRRYVVAGPWALWHVDTQHGASLHFGPLEPVTE